MENSQYFFAVDLGATSGRTVIGRLDANGLELEEVSRFDNHLITTGGHIYWDIYALYREIINSLRTVAKRQLPIKSIGIDTWGCDFVCVAPDGALLRNPLAYRDPHTMGCMDRYFNEVMGKEEVYRKTGIQFMNFNSLFQLYAMQQAGNSALGGASKILFIPDALSYMLTGKMVCEYTVASTSQLLNPHTGDLDEDLLASLDLQRQHFGPITQPGTIIGALTEEVQHLTGIGAVPVVAVAGHDTASAVAAVPAGNKKFAYLSSGTWSLMGIESSKAIINDRSFALNFTNEGGIEGTTRVLKNICGMWLYERCRQEWAETANLSHAQLQGKAMEVEGFRSLINPDDPMFANPSSMVMAIQNYCRTHGQHVPESHGEICRCIFDSLALRYRQVLAWLSELADFQIDVLHIIGGGSLNKYLNQFTANSCGLTVLAGPQEGTAIGNIMLQAKANGMVKDVWEMRHVIAQSLKIQRFEPQDKALWDAAYKRYTALCHD